MMKILAATDGSARALARGSVCRMARDVDARGRGSRAGGGRGFARGAFRSRAADDEGRVPALGRCAPSGEPNASCVAPERGESAATSRRGGSSRLPRLLRAPRPPRAPISSSSGPGGAARSGGPFSAAWPGGSSTFAGGRSSSCPVLWRAAWRGAPPSRRDRRLRRCGRGGPARGEARAARAAVARRGGDRLDSAARSLCRVLGGDPVVSAVRGASPERAPRR